MASRDPEKTSTASQVPRRLMATDMAACSLLSVAMASGMVTALLAVGVVVLVFFCGATLFLSMTRFMGH